MKFDQKQLIFPIAGTPILKLNRKAMGCLQFPLWIGILVAFVVIVIVFLMIYVNRKWEAIKFDMFMKFNILINDDEPENVNEMEFDAFVAYRWVLLHDL